MTDRLTEEIDWSDFRELRHLYMDQINPGSVTFDFINLIPRLRSLHIAFEKGPDDDDDDNPYEYDDNTDGLNWPLEGFDHLEAIHISTVSPLVRHISSFFGNSNGRPRHLSSITVHTKGPCNWNIFHLAKAIVKGQWSELTQVDIRVISKWNDVHDSGRWEDIHSLLSLPLLESVKYTRSFGIDVTTDQLSEALSTWRRLRCLHLCMTGKANHPLMDNPLAHRLDILDLFAELCPNIEDIGLTFQGYWPPTPFRGDLPQLCSLKNLDVTHSRAYDRDAILQYLSHRVEGLRSVMWDGEDLIRVGPGVPKDSWLWNTNTDRAGDGWWAWHQIAQSLPSLVRRNGM